MGIAKKIGQHFLWRGIYLVTLFVINLLMAQILGPDASGLLYLWINNFSIVVLVLGGSMESALVYYSANNQIAPHKLLTLTVAWSLAIMAICYLPAILYWTRSGYGMEDTLPLLLLMASLPFAFILINNIGGLFQGLKDFRTYNIILTIINLVLIAYLYLSYKNIRDSYSLSSGSYNIEMEMLGQNVGKVYYLSIIAQGLFMLLIFWRKLSIRKLQFPSKEELKTLLRYALMAWGANIIFFLVYRVDYWFVNYFQTGEDLGNYIQVSKLVQLFITIPALVASVLFPFTVGADPLIMRQNMARASRILFVCFFVLLLLLALVGKWLFPALYGIGFDKMYLPFIAIIPGILAISLQSLMAAWFAGTNQVKYNIYGALIALAIIVLLDVLLIPVYGITGAAIASSIAYFSYFLYQYFIFTRQSNYSIKDFIVLNKGDIQWAKELFTKSNRV